MDLEVALVDGDLVGVQAEMIQQLWPVSLISLRSRWVAARPQKPRSPNPLSRNLNVAVSQIYCRWLGILGLRAEFVAKVHPSSTGCP